MIDAGGDSTAIWLEKGDNKILFDVNIKRQKTRCSVSTSRGTVK